MAVHFIDGRTGLGTHEAVDIGPPGSIEGDEIPAVYSLGPDEILIGTSGVYEEFVLLSLRVDQSDIESFQ